MGGDRVRTSIPLYPTLPGDRQVTSGKLHDAFRQESLVTLEPHVTLGMLSLASRLGQRQ